MSNVVGIASTRVSANIGEYQDLTKVLSVVSWSIQVTTIIESMGLPISDELERQDALIPSNTKAASFGHTTVGSFITSGADKLGLNKPWDEWTKQVKALRLKKTYEIHSDSYAEIIDQFNDVTKAFGRIPASASEYHFAKDTILKKQRSESDRRFQMQASEMQERISDLMRKIEAEQRESQELKLRRVELENQLESSLQEMNLKLNEAQRNHDIDLERKLVAQRQELVSATQQQLEEMRLNSEMRVREANERLSEMTAYYENNFVAKADHDIVLQQLERERQNNFDTLKQLNDVRGTLASTISQLNEEQQALIHERERVASLSRQVEQLSTRMSTIALAPYIGESSELTAELQAQIDDLTEKLNSSNSLNTGLQLRNKNLRRKIELLKEQLEDFKRQNNTLSVKLKKSRLKLKARVRDVASVKSALLTVGALLGVSLVTSVALLFLS